MILSKDEVKKYKFILTDVVHNIKYEIYTNKKMTKKEKIMQIRLYYYNAGCSLAEPDSTIMIIAKD